MRMKEYFQTEYKAILIGLLAYCLLFASNELYGYVLIKTGIIQIEKFGSAGANSWNWHPLLLISTLISVLLLVLPGYLSGWFATRRGTINGIFVIVIGYTATFFIFSISYKHFVLDFLLILILLEHLILPVAIGAISGSAGQFHKEKIGVRP